MLITLSPSKGQDFESASLSKKYSRPADLKDSELLIKELKKIKSKKLQEMMAISENIAKLNVE
ncbi:MAG: peroxide stress protein YaaA, partial [Gammaproteobacteria bacterium]|nr:peroxide stress protein YaaA [Gammaproteobacteria bacterium]